MSNRGIGKSLEQVLRALGAVVRSSYRLAPAAVVLMILVVAIVVAATIWSTELMTGVVLLIVLAISLLLFLSSWNYGEAALALAAGLLTVYSVTWTPKKFVAFVAVWLTFSAVALLASSIRAASQLETIYLGAAAALAGHSDLAAIKTMERTLRKVASDYEGYLLGGREKAEAIRIFAFRRLPLQIFPSGLSAVDTLSTALQLDAVAVANLVCDVTKAFEGTGASDLPRSLTTFSSTLHDTAAPPSDFVEAFTNSRHLLLGRRLSPDAYFIGLKIALESGVAPAQAGDHLARSASDA